MERGVLGPVRPQAGHKRSKSSTAVLKSIITSRSHAKALSKEKENTTPPSTAASNTTPFATPIWEEFNKSSSHRQFVSTVSGIPLNDEMDRTDKILHAPGDKADEQPRGTRSKARRERPKSVVMERSKSAIDVFENFSRKENTRGETTAQQEAQFITNAKTMKVPLKADSGAEQIAKTTRTTSRDLLTIAKRGTKVMGLVAAFNKSSEPSQTTTSNDTASVDAAFEAVLESRNVPENMRKNLRMLKTTVKANLIKSNDVDFAAMAQPRSAPGSIKDRKGKKQQEQEDEEKDDSPGGDKRTPKRSRPRSRTFTLSRSKKSKSDGSDTLAKSGSFVRSSSTVSLDGRVSIDGGRSASPEEYVKYLRTEKSPHKMSIGKLHKLRQLLRNETVSWVEKFVQQGGLAETVNLLHAIMEIEWREEHEDQLLHETLLCLKALCTTDSALKKLADIADNLFPALLAMLFDKERKGPSEYTTRGVVISILIAHLKDATKDLTTLPDRARAILGYLSDPQVNENELPFITGMRLSRPFKLWHQEVQGVSREVFWIYLHHHNIVALPTETNDDNSMAECPQTSSLERNSTANEFVNAHFPRPRPPVPAAPYVGGVEWDATNYIASHLDLLNGLVASLPTRQERNELRAKLRCSYWEKTMGGTLRLCKEKFYVCIHDALRVWVAAAVADGWDVRDVRVGPKVDAGSGNSGSPRKSPAKQKSGKSDDKAPVLEAPKLDLDLRFDGLAGASAREEVRCFP